MISERMFRLLSVLFIVLVVGWISPANAFLNSNDIVVTQTDTTLSDILTPDIDTTRISDDSLEKLVPYLDDVQRRTSSSYPYIYMLVIAFSSLLSEDLAAIGAGLMAAQGLLNFWPAAFGAIGGILIGDFTLYFAGRILGNSIFEVAPFKWFLKKETIHSAEKWFEQKGPIILVISRFIPGSRFPVYLSAGLLKTSFWKFCLYFGVTVLIWTPIFVWLSVFAGNEILSYYDKYDDYAIWIMIAAAIMLFLLYKYMLPLLTRRGRKVAMAKIRRWFGR